MNPEILQALDKGACVVTATRRLAYEVNAAYNAHQLELGRTVWPSAQIKPWDSWLQKLWQAHSAHSSQLCLNLAQVQQLLADIIEADIKQQRGDNSPELAVLWNVSATAKTALDAWQLCHQWQISFTTLKASTHIDHAGFGRWATKLYARLSEHNWISPVQIADKLIAAKHAFTQDVVLFGFDHFDTQQLNFIRHYQTSEASLTQINSDMQAANTIQRYEFENTRAEWQQIGAWARDKLNRESTLKLGIITPNIENIRAIASQCLHEQLTPGYFEQAIPTPFHFSQGQSLTSTPIASSALACLDLLGSIAFEQLTPMFLSNYWGNEAERQTRARLLNVLGNRISYQFDLFQLIQAISNLGDNEAESNAKLIAKLAKLQAIKADHRSYHSIAHWQETFRQCLDTLQWPSANFNSTEFQAHQAWERCLDDWLKLDTICQPLRLNKALKSLKLHCQQTQFQVQAELNAPVQIMGVLEAAELDFDAVWLADFDEQAWPVTENTNPFIPIHQQIEAGIPAASITLQAEYAAQKTAQLFALCHDTQVSHARNHDDISLAISPILAEISVAVLTDLPQAFSLNEAIRSATPALLIKQDDIGYALDADYARGGTGLIQAQSACPFKAYAQYRLLLSELPTPEMGIDNMRRGSLLHDALASVWSELKNSKLLQKHIEQGSLADLIDGHTYKLVTRYAKLSGLDRGFINAQAQRLNALIIEWLNLEAKRPAFSIVACEKKIEHTIDGLKLNFTLDRVDEIQASEDGPLNNVTQLIMDYKSGNCELKDWAGDRLEQPQIPLYYLALDQQSSATPVAALVFGQVKQGAVKFVGISLDEGLLPGVTSLKKSRSISLKKDISEWAEIKPKWDARLKILVNEFQNGVAHVDPKSAASCNYCEFGALCRVESQTMRENEYGTD